MKNLLLIDETNFNIKGEELPPPNFPPIEENIPAKGPESVIEKRPETDPDPARVIPINRDKKTDWRPLVWALVGFLVIVIIFMLKNIYDNARK